MDEIKLLAIMGDYDVEKVIVDPNWNKVTETPVPHSIGAIAWVERLPGEDDQAFVQRAKLEAEQMTKEVLENMEQSQ